MVDNINYLTIEDSESLEIENVRSMDRSYVSSRQVDLIGSFIFGRELAEYSEGCYIYLTSFQGGFCLFVSMEAFLFGMCSIKNPQAWITWCPG